MQLLGELLVTPVPLENNPLRPPTLRSADEQRRTALGSYRLRTWFDHLLRHSERILMLAAVVVFIYWFADGYGRDWYYELTRPPGQPALRISGLPTARPAIASAAGSDSPAPPTAFVALPYTTPDMERPIAPPDYLVPRSFTAPAAPRDERPYRLVMPTIGVDTPVVEVYVVEGSWQVADYAAGYHQGSALPGAIGNTVMAGHAGLRGGVFRDLGALSPGDDLFIEAGGWVYRYRVRDLQAVWPTQVEVTYPTPTAVLTLITCTNWDTQRLVVTADLVDSRPLT